MYHQSTHTTDLPSEINPLKIASMIASHGMSIFCQENNILACEMRSTVYKWSLYSIDKLQVQVYSATTHYGGPDTKVRD